MKSKRLVEITELRDRTGVFADREDAGRILASMLEELRGSGAVVFAVPAGGVPVAAALAEELGLSLEAAAVSKITLPWNTEAGYGAVAFNGSVGLNDDLLDGLRLSDEEIAEGIEKTREKVMRRMELFREGRSPVVPAGRTVVLVDDGLASGFTMLVAAEAVRREGAGEVIVAVPTGHLESTQRLLEEVDALYCANVRAGWSFAVADAYRAWRDVTEEEAVRIFRGSSGKRGG